MKDNKNRLKDIRTRKLGLLIYDARVHFNQSQENCANVMGISLEEFQTIEKGKKAPTLPQIERLAYFLKITPDHFWGTQTVSQIDKTKDLPDLEKFSQLRNRIIAATVRQKREISKLSTEQLAEETQIDLEKLLHFESGQLELSLPELELISQRLDIPIESLLDKNGTIGKWREQTMKNLEFEALPDEIQNFLIQPINMPYIELAMRLSYLSVDKLRAIGEGILEITF
jgi:transcriptional regulator with XRE-family HTH domain